MAIKQLLVLASSIQRRGYSGVSHGSVSAGLGKGGYRSSMVGRLEDQRVGLNVMKEESELGASSSWAPDPRTGYYRPENRGADEIDPVELRQRLLNHKVLRPQ